MDLNNQATDDYLKIIYELETAQGRATTGAIAGRLGISPASVTGMVQKLAAADPPLADYRKRRGTVLTPAGERRALRVIRRHRLLETFLHDALGYSWDEVHEEAERLEHAISGELAARIEQVLDYPARDPHGAPIPGADLSLKRAGSQPLAALAPGRPAVVWRVEDQVPALLRALERLGIRPGARVERLGGDPLRLLVDGEPCTLPAELVAQIYVIPAAEKGPAAIDDTEFS